MIFTLRGLATGLPAWGRKPSGDFPRHSNCISAPPPVNVQYRIDWIDTILKYFRISVVYEKPKGGSNSVVECQLPKLDVAGSTPVSRSNFFNDLHSPVSPCAPFVLRLHYLQAFL